MTPTSTMRCAFPSPWATLAFVAFVVVAVGSVATVLHSSMWGGCPGDKLGTARNQAMELGKNVEHFRLKLGRYPTSAEGLAVLVAPPSGEPLVDWLPLDPWGHPYVMRMPGIINGSKFDVVSAGPDEVFNTGDDVGNWMHVP